MKIETPEQCAEAIEALAAYIERPQTEYSYILGKLVRGIGHDAAGTGITEAEGKLINIATAVFQEEYPLDSVAPTYQEHNRPPDVDA